jgi:GT2 family glycosyltransferase
MFRYPELAHGENSGREHRARIGTMRVSVVVPTYKRPQSLARCLDALDSQQYQPQETIVVVRGGDTASQELVRGRAKPVRLVLVEHPGVVAAMNAGIATSRGDVVALTDDDSAPYPDWLARVVSVFESDVDGQLAAVGGRDWVHTQKGLLLDGSAGTVGAISWFGRVTGNHHLGVGPPRDVDLLKGVNLIVIGDLLRRVRIDERLLGVGTEHHWELSLCLTLRRQGFRILYDPAIAVDHHPQPRVDDSRRFSSRELRDSTHNETLALLEYLPPWRRASYVAWAFAIGTSSTPGVVQMIRSLSARDSAGWSQFRGAQSGLIGGMRTYRRSRRAQHSHVGNENPARPTPDARAAER